MGNFFAAGNEERRPCGVRVESEASGGKDCPNRAFDFGPRAESTYQKMLPKQKKAATRWLRNTIKTSKYEWYNFIYLSLKEQFRRTANYFFLGMSFLMIIGTYTNLYQSALNPWSTLGSMLVVMTCTMILQVWDDYGRHKNDHEVNIRETRSLGAQENIQWQDVKVGEIILVRNSESFPADLIQLCSGELDGISYVETSNIDGETNLKIRSSPSPELTKIIQGDNPGDATSAMDRVRKLSATIDYLKPDPKVSLEHFDGTLKEILFDGNVLPGKRRIALDKAHHLLRGATLRNTKWVLGLVVYTGEQTKLALNSSANRGKLSNMENVVNGLLYIVFAVMFVMVTVTDIAQAIWRKKNFNGKFADWWYLFPDGVDEDYDLPIWIAQWFTYAILYTNFVPLSMYVTMEFINFWHAKFINEDLKMYDPETDTPAHTRSFNLCAELGQIEYVFSDKTGTLTQNKMEFKMCSIGNGSNNKIYGDLEADEFTDVTISKFVESIGKKTTSSNAASKTSAATKSSSVALSTNEEWVHQFFFGMAVNHTVVAEKDPEQPHGVVYQAESPDEGALVGAAAKLGWIFLARSARTITVRMPSGQQKSLVVLAINKFNSTRKRSSVVVKDLDSGKIVLYCKGADNMMLERASASVSQRKKIDRDLSTFSKKGLRTLVFGMREISPKEFEKWIAEYEKANTSASNKRAKRMAVAEKIEKGMVLLGASAIEDKLQKDVPNTIADIRKAGVKVWVLTGDKMETAINIGFSCKLLVHENMKILKMKVEESDSDEISAKRKELEKTSDDDKLSLARIRAQLDEMISVQSEMRKADVAKALYSILEHIASPTTSNFAEGISMKEDDDAVDDDSKRIFLGKLPSVETPDNTDVEDPSLMKDNLVTNDFSTLDTFNAGDQELALVITGATIEIIMNDENFKRALLRIGMACSVVVACRVSPAQKALMVKMVREGITPTPVTLAIGDGANDVEMIKEAQVGIGISGREGLQAANSADFSIAQFRFLRRLLFIHGRWNYRRMSKVILFSFYKNIVLVLTLFYYQFLTGFSGTSMYEDYLQSCFNIFLFFSPVALGLFDQDVPESIVNKFPELYQSGLCQLDLNKYTMIETVVLALFNSFIVFGFPALAFNSMNDGVNNGVYSIGTLCFTCLIVTMEYRCLFITVTWNKYVHYLWFATVLLYLLFLFLYGGVVCLSLGPFFYYVPMELVKMPIFWMVITGVPMTAITFDLLAAYIKREFFPNFVDLCAELTTGYVAQSEDHRQFLERNRMESLTQISDAVQSMLTLNVNKEGRETRLKSLASGDPALPDNADAPISGDGGTPKRRHRRNKSGVTTVRDDMARIADTIRSASDVTHGDPSLISKKSIVRSLHSSDHRKVASMFDAPTVVDGDGNQDDAPDGLVLKHLTTQGTLDLKSLGTIDLHSVDTSGVDELPPSSIPPMTPAATKIDVKDAMKKEDEKDFKNRPEYAALYQQTLPSTQVIVTPTHTAMLLAFVTVVSFVLGGVLWSANNDVIELQMQYAGEKTSPDNDATLFTSYSADCYNETKSTCHINFYVTEKLDAPIFVNYRLTKFYQNYQAYFLSRDAWELMGKHDSATGCPANSRMGIGQTKTCDTGRTLFENGVQTNDCKDLVPCGRAAYSYFSDTFEIVTPSACSCQNLTESEIPIGFDCNSCQVFTPTFDTNDLRGWASDDDFYSNKPSGDPSTSQYLADRFPEQLAESGIKDPHFMSWMRLAALPDFMKRYGVITRDIPANSQITFEVNNTFAVNSYGGSKYLIMLSHSWRGPAKDEGLAWMFFATGMMSSFWIVVVLLQRLYCPRKMGEAFVKKQIEEDSIHVHEIRERFTSGVSEYDAEFGTQDVLSVLRKEEKTLRHRLSSRGKMDVELARVGLEEKSNGESPSSPIATAVVPPGISVDDDDNDGY